MMKARMAGGARTQPDAQDMKYAELATMDGIIWDGKIICLDSAEVLARAWPNDKKDAPFIERTFDLRYINGTTIPDEIQSSLREKHPEWDGKEPLVFRARADIYPKRVDVSVEKLVYDPIGHLSRIEPGDAMHAVDFVRSRLRELGVATDRTLIIEAYVAFDSGGRIFLGCPSALEIEPLYESRNAELGFTDLRDYEVFCEKYQAPEAEWVTAGTSAVFYESMNGPPVSIIANTMVRALGNSGGTDLARLVMYAPTAFKQGSVVLLCEQGFRGKVA
jgi:hypothetical protein